MELLAVGFLALFCLPLHHNVVQINCVVLHENVPENKGSIAGIVLAAIIISMLI